MPKIEFRLAFNQNIYLDQANKFRSRIADLIIHQDFGSLVILFSSDGGSTDQSLALFNFIAGLPVPIHMHCIGHTGSASLPVFLAGYKRTCAPFSRFFVHEYDWAFTARQTLDRMVEAQQRLRSDIDMARKIIQSRTKVGADILDALDGRAPPAVLDPAQAKALGIVEDVCELDKSGANGMQVAICT